MPRITMSVFMLLLSFFMMQSTYAKVDTTSPSYEYRTFATCQEFEDTLKTILPKTYDGRMYKGGMLLAETAAVPMAPAVSLVSKADTNTPKSDTNVQVKGIDEADTVKTDGNYVYSYQEGEHSIVILDAKTLNIVKKIRVAQNYSGVSFYITANKLVLTATKSIPYQNSWTYWYNNSQKTIIAIYNIQDVARASLIRSIEVDGYLSDSRLSENGMMTAVVTTSYWMPPIYRYYDVSSKMVPPKFDYSTKNLLPRISDQQFSK